MSTCGAFVTLLQFPLFVWEAHDESNALWVSLLISLKSDFVIAFSIAFLGQRFQLRLHAAGVPESTASRLYVITEATSYQRDCV